jgi:hypothetical protein
MLMLLDVTKMIIKSHSLSLHPVRLLSAGYYRGGTTTARTEKSSLGRVLGAVYDLMIDNEAFLFETFERIFE